MWIRFGHWLPVSVLVKSGYAETNALAVAILGALFAAGVVLVTHSARLGRGDVVALRPAPAAAAALAILAGLLPLAMLCDGLALQTHAPLRMPGRADPAL